jgi:hypothetical protein
MAEIDTSGLIPIAIVADMLESWDGHNPEKFSAEIVKVMRQVGWGPVQPVTIEAVKKTSWFKKRRKT